MTRIFLLGVFLLFAVVSYVTTAELYSDKYDNINIEEILKNPKLRKQYSMCYLGTGPCQTDAARFFKETFADAVVTKCDKCSEKQKMIFEKIVLYYINEEPATWQMILQNVAKRRSS